MRRDRVVGIIQARMGSRRLPGKTLMTIGGCSVLANVVNRVRRATRLQTVVIATTQRSADDVIVSEAEELRVRIFRGDEEDVLRRYYKAALMSSADTIVRITADCPLIDPAVIDKVVDAFGPGSDQFDYASNTLHRTYPVGLDVEVFSMSALATAFRMAQSPYDREHVTPFIYMHPELFKLRNVADQVDHSSLRWTLDTVEDLKRLRTIFAEAAINPTYMPSLTQLLHVVTGCAGSLSE